MSVHLANNQDNFEEGQTDIFAGPSSLGECYNFDLGTITDADDVCEFYKTFCFNFSSFQIIFFIAITLYHSGTDGGKFDWVQVLTTTNKIYRCQIGVFMDGSNYIKGTGCTLVN